MNNQICNHHIDRKQPINRPNPGEGSAKDLKIGDIFTNLKIQESRVKCNFPEDGHGHWKYSWNVHCVLTNHMRELVTVENEWVSPSFLRHRGMRRCLWHGVRFSESRRQTLTQYVYAPVLRSNANTSKPRGSTPSLSCLVYAAVKVRLSVSWQHTPTQHLREYPPASQKKLPATLLAYDVFG